MHRSIPTPAISLVEVGPFTIHFYALFIIAGVAFAIWLGDKRFVNGDVARVNVVADVAIVAVPLGVIGGRLYHVLSSPAQYFGEDGDFLAAFKIWEGGLGIWGAIALGSLGAYLSYSRLSKEKNLPAFTYFLDSLAPGVLIAQGIGRFGNWFNGELFGRPLTAPFALSIPSELRPEGFQNFQTFHPTFAYEALWAFLIAGLLIWVTPKFKSGQLFLLYIALYCLGRFFIEMLRIDTATIIFGMRINLWVSLLIGLGATITIIRISRKSGRL